MKVLHVYKTYLPDDFTGVPRVIHSIAEGTASKGIESHVFALTRQPDESSLKVGEHLVHRVRRNFQIASTDISFRAFRSFKQHSETADVIHYHYPWPFGDLLWLHSGARKPSVVTYHSDIVKQRTLSKLYAPLRDHFLNRVDAIVATSPNYVVSSTVLSHLSKPVDLIPIGIEPRPTVNAVVRQSWQRRLASDFFLFVGAARYYKGIDFLLQAAALSGLPVVIAGEADDLQRAQLPDNVVAVGKITDEDKEALLDLCRGFVFPSHLRSEAFGVALLEAARAGKPMISCEIGTGTTYVNVDGDTGIVVPPQSGAHIAQAMQTLASDAALAVEMGKRAKERYASLFTQDKMAEAYAGLYRRLTDVD
jgi:O-antigen biosynthesis rhamnosyltransferase